MKLNNYRGYSRPVYAKRSSGGVCPVCGGDRDDGWILCSYCRAKARASNKRMSAALKVKHSTDYKKKCRRLHKCYCCGTQLNGNGKTRCQPCRDKAKVHNLNYQVRKIKEVANESAKTNISTNG